MTDQPTVRNVRQYDGSSLPKYDIDENVKDVTLGAVPRHPNHEARDGQERNWCDFAALQEQNLDDLVAGRSELGRPREIERPIYVWRHGDHQIIVDGIKTYLAAQKHRRAIEVWELEFESLNEAKLWRWYINVAASTQIPEDVRIWRFLEHFSRLIDKWRAQGRHNQSKKKLDSDAERMNWRERTAEMCQASRHHVDSTYKMRRFAEWAASQKLEDLSDRDKVKIKLIEDGVCAVLSGARQASSVISDIKGGATRSSRDTKGAINANNKNAPNPAGALTEYDPNLESQLEVRK